MENGVKFDYVSAAGESNHPGEVWFECVYTLTPAGELSIEMSAITDQATPVNLTNHTYLNLAGEDSGEAVYGHEARFRCDRYLDIDPAEGTVTGEVKAVEGTKYDLREYVALGERIKAGGRWPEEGFDNYFVR